MLRSRNIGNIWLMYQSGTHHKICYSIFEFTYRNDAASWPSIARGLMAYARAIAHCIRRRLVYSMVLVGELFPLCDFWFYIFCFAERIQYTSAQDILFHTYCKLYGAFHMKYEICIHKSNDGPKTNSSRLPADWQSQIDSLVVDFQSKQKTIYKENFQYR